MAIVISFGLSKGGTGKTTTTAITAYFLAKKHRVLVIDLDEQGNLARFITVKQKNSFDKTIYEALKKNDIESNITVFNESLHVVASNDKTVRINQLLEDKDEGNRFNLLSSSLASVQDKYDYILIDLPPNMGDQTVMGLTASNYTVVPIQTDILAYEALNDYFELCQIVKRKYNSRLNVVGILPVMYDKRASLETKIMKQVRSTYGERVFKSEIKRKARIKEFSALGISDTMMADKKVLKEYKDYVKELEQRVK